MSSDPFTQNEENAESDFQETGSGRKRLLILILCGVLLAGGAYFYFYIYAQKDADASSGMLYEPDEASHHVGKPKKPIDLHPSKVPPTPAALGVNHVEKQEEVHMHDTHLPTLHAKEIPSHEMNASHHTSNSLDEKSVSGSKAEAPELMEPANNSQWQYDGTSGYPLLVWKSAQSSTVMISRDAKMKRNIEVEHQTRDTKYEFRSVMPGTYYWKAVNASGSSEIRSFLIQPVVKRKIMLKTPTEGSTVAGDQVEISWQGDEKVNLYKVQYSVSQSVFIPQQDFQTVGNKLTLAHLPSGIVLIRIGAFSLVSEQWEYTEPTKITVK